MEVRVRPLFDKSGGYRKLTSFTFATLIHLGTIRFCKRFIPFKEDTLGKITGQMIGAARSGRQNIIEGSERSGTSKETEMKLTDVAKASLAELLGDFEMFLAERNAIPWSVQSREYQAVWQLNPVAFEFSDDVMHDYWIYFHREKGAFEPWSGSSDPVIAANSLIILIRRTMAMLGSQLQHQGEAFLSEGGFRERLHQCRTEAREAASAAEPLPACPECGKPMHKRKARAGNNAGQEFWGCSGYPECKGSRRFQPSLSTHNQPSPIPGS
jgi:four helix bundle suffix protein